MKPVNMVPKATREPIPSVAREVMPFGHCITSITVITLLGVQCCKFPKPCV